jgi:spore germination cell wall hydrolase CwlJ-like protein
MGCRKLTYLSAKRQNETTENTGLKVVYRAKNLGQGFLRVDPLAHLREWVSPYNFVQNNPIMRTDPTGALDGDYFDKDGTHLGSDGIDDGKVYTVEGTSKFNANDFGEGGKYFNNQSGFNEANGNGYSVSEIGMDSDLGKMMRTVYAEAAGQGSESKLAVAEVIRNRANDNTAPSKANKYTAQFSGVSTYGEVVGQSGQFESVQSGAARYSNPLSVTSGNIIEQRAFVGSAGAAIKAHYQNTSTAGGALFFYSPYITAPSWTTVLQKVNVSGVSNSNFRFYKYK